MALVDDDEFFVEIADPDLCSAICADEGQEFYDTLDPDSIVPTRPTDEKEWAIVDYKYEDNDNYS